MDFETNMRPINEMELGLFLRKNVREQKKGEAGNTCYIAGFDVFFREPIMGLELTKCSLRIRRFGVRISTGAQIKKTA
jgi:hypothetical protein